MALLVAIGGIIGLATLRDTARDTPEQTPTASTTTTTTPPSTGKSKTLEFGISDNLADLPPAELDRRTMRLRQAGLTWRRTDVRWDTAEKVPGQYNYSRTEPTITRVARAGFKQVLITAYAPQQWAGVGQENCGGEVRCSPAATAEAIAAYGRFNGNTAKHFCDPRYGVEAIEVWNEQNLSKYWPHPDPQLYVAYLKAASTAIKANCTRLDVLFGGLGDRACDGCIPATRFLEAVYRAGGWVLFDAVSCHAYPKQAGALPRDWSPLAQHAIMQRYGDGAKQIWVTEFSFDTPDPQVQARQLRTAIALLRKQPWAGPFFWFSYQDSGERRMGLVDQAGRDKPVLDELEQLAS